MLDSTEEVQQSLVAIVMIDVINDLEFEDGEKLLETALPMAKNLKALKARAKSNRIPVIYVNDNFGRWRSDFRHLVEHCSQPGVRGAEIVKLLHPDSDDYFVLKPRHSGFYGSALEILLKSLGVQKLILTGLAGNICVLYTANDAYMRGFKVLVASDCTASNSVELNDNALEQMASQLKAEVLRGSDIDLNKLRADSEAASA